MISAPTTTNPRKNTMKTNTEQNSISARRIAATRFPKLTAAVLASVDAESLPDVVNHGASGGYGNFIYYSDTLAFFDANRADILALAKELAADYGETDALTMISGFNCLRADKLTPTDICEAIHGETDNTQAVKNALAWFALEEIARELCPDL